MEDELILDLTTELSLTDKNFNSELLASKVKSAIKEVRTARKYPNGYSEERIAKDLDGFYSNIRAIALLDYNKIGIEHEESHAENGSTLHFVDRNKLFDGILPLSKC